MAENENLLGFFFWISYHSWWLICFSSCVAVMNRTKRRRWTAPHCPAVGRACSAASATVPVSPIHAAVMGWRTVRTGVMRNRKLAVEWRGNATRPCTLSATPRKSASHRNGSAMTKVCQSATFHCRLFAHLILLVQFLFIFLHLHKFQNEIIWEDDVIQLRW